MKQKNGLSHQVYPSGYKNRSTAAEMPSENAKVFSNLLRAAFCPLPKWLIDHLRCVNVPCGELPYVHPHQAKGSSREVNITDGANKKLTYSQSIGAILKVLRKIPACAFLNSETWTTSPRALVTDRSPCFLAEDRQTHEEHYSSSCLLYTSEG